MKITDEEAQRVLDEMDDEPARMTTEQVIEHLRCKVNCSDPECHEARDRATEALTTSARALWAVRVLDACGDWNTFVGPRVNGPEESYVLVDDDPEAHFGPTPDAARHAAALAVWHTIGIKAQGRIGECP